MNATCGMPPADAPVVELTLAGAGESLIRLEKRLACAAAGLGLRLVTTVVKNPEALGIPYAQTPALLVNGRVMLSGLPRTEEIAAWLRHTYPTQTSP